MKRRFVVIGKRVHEVGYRTFLLEKAFQLGFNRFVAFNTRVEGREAVVALAEGEEKQLRALREAIEQERPERAEVEGIVEEAFNEEVPSIERGFLAFQSEQWAKGIPILLEMRDDQKEMLKKQDQMLRELSNLRQDVSTLGQSFEGISQRLESMSNTLKDIAKALRDLAGKK